MGSITSDSKPPEYGRRLIPQVIDEIAARDPQREAFQLPRSDTDPKKGWKVVTYGEYAAAINRSAHEVVKTCGAPPTDEFPTIAYIGPQDVRYLILLVAAVKAGYKVLFVSPRNSREAHLNLFDKTNCRIVWFAEPFGPTIESWLKEREMRAHQVGSVEGWLPENGDISTPHFPFDKTFEKAQWEPLAVLHTSGSTGLPKPVIIKHGMLAVSDAYHNVPDWQEASYYMKAWAQMSKRHLLPFPLFHSAGLYLFFFSIAFWDTPVALGLGGRPLSADLIIECLNHADVDSIALAPSILEDMSHDEEQIAALSKLKLVLFGSANLAQDAGDRLAKKGVNLLNLIGTTEFASGPLYVRHKPDPSLWSYFNINSELFGCEWRRDDNEDDSEAPYELVVVRKNKDPGLQGHFYTFPELNEFKTGDLFKPHPTVPNHWAYYGRADDIIVFSNGEKLNPVTIEQIVREHPQVKGVLVVGAGKFQPALLLEPLVQPKTKEEEHAFIDAVWPFVEKANRETVAHGQISRDYIMIGSPDKPFHRAGKGTVQRPATVKAYAAEINKLYEEVNTESRIEVSPIDTSSEESLIQWINDAFETHVQAPRLEPDTNFFTAGIDSRQIINAASVLKAGLAASGLAVGGDTSGPRAFYNNPSLRELSQYIFHSIVHGKGAEEAGQEDREVQAMKSLLEKYTSNFIKGKAGRPDPATNGQTVLLTGSTGALGSYLLDLLVKNPTVAKVVCLNRAADGGAQQQAKAMQERGLARNYTEKTEFYQVDLSLPGLGLPGAVYTRLLEEADRVIHNAWPVNFNISTRTFEPHIRGVRHLADLAAQANKRVAIVFVSSIGSVERWDRAKGPVPEEKLEDLRSSRNGYGRSKLLGGLILEDAAKAGDFPAAVIRVGQIAGPESDSGAWNRQEWLPSIVASSLYLGALPKELGGMNVVDWTPIERVAQLVLDVLGVSGDVDAKDINGYFHGVNPSTTTWDASLAQAVQQFYGNERIKELISFGEWVDRLEKTQADNAEKLAANPGLKLIDTYRVMALSQPDTPPLAFDMQRSIARSQTMREAPAVTPELMRHWCAQWAF